MACMARRPEMRRRLQALVVACLAVVARNGTAQTPGTVAYDIHITEDRGGFTGVLDPDDLFGTSTASLGDLDGNGVGDIVVGAYGDDDGGSSKGALWVLFLDTDF